MIDLFYSTKKVFLQILDKNNLSVNINLEAFDYKELNYLDTAKIYFTTHRIFEIVKNSARQFNEESILKLIDKKEDIKSKYLYEKNVFTKKEKLQSNDLKIALVFDIDTKFESEFNKSVISNLNYLYENLANKYQDVQFDLFTIYLSELVNLAKDIPLTNLYLIPETLEKLISYDAYIKFSDLVNEQNIIEKAKIDQCLKILGIENITSNIQLIKNNDLVSIIIPTYNRQDLLKESVESVINQTYKNIELIIVDDGSIDNTKAVVENYLSDPRVKYIYQINKGLGEARNNGILNSKGNYLMFLDDDDIYLPYAVEKMLLFFKKQPDNVKLIYGDLIYFNTIAKKYHKEPKIEPKPTLYTQLIISNILTTPGQVIAYTQAVKDVGMYDSNVNGTEDYDLWTKIALNYDIAKIDLAVVSYRKHELQKTSNLGSIRYYSDLVAFKFLYKLIANKVKLFNDDDSILLDEKLDDLAMKAINGYFNHYDTGLEILRFAHKIKFNQDRENIISNFSKNIPVAIKEKFNSELRITEEQKEKIRNNIF